MLCVNVGPNCTAGGLRPAHQRYVQLHYTEDWGRIPLIILIRSASGFERAVCKNKFATLRSLLRHRGTSMHLRKALTSRSCLDVMAVRTRLPEGVCRAGLPRRAGAMACHGAPQGCEFMLRGRPVQLNIACSALHEWAFAASSVGRVFCPHLEICAFERQHVANTAVPWRIVRFRCGTCMPNQTLERQLPGRHLHIA